MNIEVCNDPRFDTLYKRVNFFRRPHECDEALAARLGITVQTLKRWRQTGETPNEQMTFYMSLAQRFDVEELWLSAMATHTVNPFPDGKHRLTSILRFRPYIHFVDRIDDDEPRPLFEYRASEKEFLPAQ